MNLNYNFFKVSDGHSLAYKKWDNIDTPLGVVIIIHGMAEHIERYDEFAESLNSRGFIVYGADQRGHGKTSGKKGLFTYDKDWSKVVKDQTEFFGFVKKIHENLDISYVAHSMGSYIARHLISSEKLPIKKIILSGTGYEPAAKASIAIKLAGLITKTNGLGEDAVFLDKMVNEPFAASINNPVTSFDWLSKDHTAVAKYINDPNCGFICSNKFYLDFFKIVALACKKSFIKKIDKKLPILLYSGSHDPVGGKNLSGVGKLFKIYTALGLNCEFKINDGGRHESLNETNRGEVYKIFADFLI